MRNEIAFEIVTEFIILMSNILTVNQFCLGYWQKHRDQSSF